jgi:hypothetical protein|tara:strand:+ start:43 stop:387 length:345 start_codon:yes stop_codon:yes gene_type:complete
MSIYVRNLTIDAHSDFSEPLELFQTGGTRTNLTGMSGAAQMRKHPDSSTAYDFTVGITSAVDGKLELSMTDTLTASIKPGRYLYDLMLTRANGSKVVVVEGSVNVRAGFSINCP